VSRDDTWTRAPRRGPQVTLDGRPFFHLVGPATGGSRYEVYGHVDGDRLVQLAFETAERPPVRQRLIGSVLATLHLG
jgi:hypothetical protein